MNAKNLICEKCTALTSIRENIAIR